MENKPKLLGSIFVPILASAGAMFLLVAFLIYKWMLHIEIEDGKRFAHTSLNSLALKCEASSSLSDLQRMMLSMKTSGPILDIYFSDDSSVILSCKLSERRWVSPVLNAFHIFLETNAAKSFRFVISKGGISVFFAELL